MINEQNENENDIEKMVGRIVSETNNDARSRSLGGSRRTVAKSRWRNQGGSNSNHTSQTINGLEVERRPSRRRDESRKCSNCCMHDLLTKYDEFKEIDVVCLPIVRGTT